MSVRFSVCVILFLSLVSFVAAQTHPATARNAELKGQVRVADGRPGMVGSEVSVDQRGGGNNGLVQTDRDGKFQFSQIVPDIYVVTVRAPGYLVEPQEVDLRLVTMGYLTFTLKPDPKLGGMKLD